MTTTNDFTLLSNNNLLACFNKYKGWLAKYLLKQGVESPEDAGQEAYIIFAETVAKVDLAKVTSPSCWSLHVFLKQSLITRSKRIAKSVQSMALASEVFEDVVADTRRSFLDSLVQQLHHTQLVNSIAGTFRSEAQQRIAALLLQGFTQSQTAKILGVSRQRVGFVVTSHRQFFQSVVG